MGRQLLVAQLERVMNQLGILLPGTPGRVALDGLMMQMTPENRHALALDDEAFAERWPAENAEALASSNAYFDKHGLPLAHPRPEGQV